MSSILFRGAFIRYFDTRLSEGGEVFTRIYFSADWSDKVRDSMAWEEIPECAVGSVKLNGELLATNLTLIPGDKALKDYSIDLALSEVSSFELISKLPKEDGESRERYLKFTAIATSEEAPTWCNNYLRRVGHHRGQRKVNYSKQGDLFDAEQKEEAGAEA